MGIIYQSAKIILDFYRKVPQIEIYEQILRI